MLMLDPWTGTILDVNPAASAFYGYPRDVLCTMKIGEINQLSPEEVARLRREISEGSLQYFVAPHRISDGSVRTVEIHSSPISVGSRQYLFSIIHDITDRKKAEEALRENEERLRLVNDSSKDSIYSYDRAGRFTSANRKLCENMHMRPDQIIGKTHEELGFPREICREWDALHSRVYTTDISLTAETKTPMPDGAVHDYEVVLNPIHDSTGAIMGISGITRDITERKAIEAERERLARQREALITDLEQKNAELERFTYTVSHDLKSPLITIRGFAGLVEEDIRNNDTAAVKRDLDRIDAATEKMEMLLKDLLNLSRIGRIVNPPENVSFTEIAQEAIELLNAPLKKREVTVTIYPDMPVVSVDRGRVREVVTNLVENAIKFMGDQQHPEIHIGVHEDGNRPVFFIRDNGIGIDPRYHERIFNLFEKLDVLKEGSGAGLAIVKRIIEVHGGTIRVESEGPGKGTTFLFTLPLALTAETDTHNKGKGRE